jgi:hypothetical protein
MSYISEDINHVVIDMDIVTETVKSPEPYQPVVPLYEPKESEE